MKTKRFFATLTITAIILAAGIVGATESAGGVVNINTADASQLELLPRVGPALSSRIIDFRDTNGPFKSVDELVAVKGFGERSLENLKPYLAIDGDTTLTAKVHLPRKQRTDSAS